MILQYWKVPEECKNRVTPTHLHQTTEVGITLLSTSLKLLTKIIANEITSIMLIGEEQQGTNRFTNDALFIPTQRVEKLK